jgi:menaquinone-dependent protoporphyrinogen oxidase
MNEKILVTYASQAGSTAGVAEAIGKTLMGTGFEVDVMPMYAVKDVAEYHAVVAGSAIHGSKWLPEGLQFLRTHQTTLARKPVATFMVCITLGMKNAEKYREGLTAWMAPTRALVRPVSEGYFAGSLDFKKLPFAISTLGMRLAVLLGIFPKGDQRNWQKIDAWASSLPALLK